MHKHSTVSMLYFYEYIISMGSDQLESWQKCIIKISEYLIASAWGGGGGGQAYETGRYLFLTF
jgi:hypothetical protein